MNATKQLAGQLAATYMGSKGITPSAAERVMFSNWLQTQYSRIGHVVQYTPEPVSPERLLQVWRQDGKLLISSHANFHPFWLSAENLAFRAVHDYHHISGFHGFDLNGEIGTYYRAALSAPSSIHWILWSEIVLQAAACIYTGKFQRQKLVLAHAPDPAFV